MKWIGYNFYEKNTNKNIAQNGYLIFLKKIIESTGNSTFKISSKIKELDLDYYDAFSTLGLKKKNRHIDVNSNIDVIERTKKPNLIRDQTILRAIPKYTGLPESGYHSFMFNSIKPLTNNFPYDGSYDRWGYLKKKYNLVVRDYHYPGDNILFILQLHTDASLNFFNFGNQNYLTFIINNINDLLIISDRKIIIRSHPEYKNKNKKDKITNYLLNYYKDSNRIFFSKNDNLQDDLDISNCVISYNSNASLEALLYGINVINLSIANPCLEAASNKLSDVEDLKEKNRDMLLKQVAFLHWESEELKSIENRKYLSRLFEKKISNLMLEQNKS
jgi:hypothetical protein